MILGPLLLRHDDNEKNTCPFWYYRAVDGTRNSSILRHPVAPGSLRGYSHICHSFRIVARCFGVGSRLCAADKDVVDGDVDCDDGQYKKNVDSVRDAHTELDDVANRAGR